MATRLRITCINKKKHDNPHERITHVGGKNANSNPWKMTQEAAISGIENKTHEFYVIAGGREVDVIVATHNGRKYLKTRNDGYSPDNLLSLPECP